MTFGKLQAHVQGESAHCCNITRSAPRNSDPASRFLRVSSIGALRAVWSFLSSSVTCLDQSLSCVVACCLPENASSSRASDNPLIMFSRALFNCSVSAEIAQTLEVTSSLWPHLQLFSVFIAFSKAGAALLSQSDAAAISPKDPRTRC